VFLLWNGRLVYNAILLQINYHHLSTKEEEGKNVAGLSQQTLQGKRTITTTTTTVYDRKEREEEEEENGNSRTKLLHINMKWI